MQFAISMLLHASPVWMKHVEPKRRSECSAGMFGRILLLHRGCGRRCQDMLVSVYQWISNLLCCPTVRGSSFLFLQIPGMGLYGLDRGGL